MPSLSIARAANAAFKPSFKPVAVFVGGTSGIGQATAEALARHTKGNLHIVLVGRKTEAADAIFQRLPRSAESKYEFVKCDASLMHEVRRVSADLRKTLPKINYLVLSPGILTMAGRTETEEGIDRKMVLHYYARWRFINELMPLLEKAKEGGEDAKVLSVLSAGWGGSVYEDDLDLKRNFSLKKCADVCITYNDFMVEDYASQHPNMTFVHTYPGAVRTSLTEGRDLSFPMRLAMKAAYPILYPFMTSMDDCGEYMLNSLLSADTGAHWKDNKGDDVGRSKYSDDALRKKVWDHTESLTR